MVMGMEWWLQGSTVFESFTFKRLNLVGRVLSNLPRQIVVGKLSKLVQLGTRSFLSISYFGINWCHLHEVLVQLTTAWFLAVQALPDVS